MWDRVQESLNVHHKEMCYICWCDHHVSATLFPEGNKMLGVAASIADAGLRKSGELAPAVCSA